MRYLFGAGIAILSSYLFFLSIMLSYLISDFFIAPIRIISLELIETKIKPDELLKYYAVYERVKPCRTDIQRFIISSDVKLFESKMPPPGSTSVLLADGTRFVGYRDSEIGLITQESSEIKIVSTLEHPPLPVGKYQLRTYVISGCTMITRVDAFPVADFEVVE